jgi:hypothetical protein
MTALDARRFCASLGNCSSELLYIQHLVPPRSPSLDVQSSSQGAALSKEESASRRSKLHFCGVPNASWQPAGCAGRMALLPPCSYEACRCCGSNAERGKPPSDHIISPDGDSTK